MGGRDTAVAFADLVGFTELGETIPSEELGSVAGRLSRLAEEAIEPPVKIVKEIGDAVMLVSPEPAPLVRVHAAARRGLRRRRGPPGDPGRRRLRPGRATAGATGTARPSTSPAGSPSAPARPPCSPTENVRDAADGFLWSYAGEKKLKGLSRRSGPTAPAAPTKGDSLSPRWGASAPSRSPRAGASSSTRRPRSSARRRRSRSRRSSSTAAARG